jgi:hypothetical protein
MKFSHRILLVNERNKTIDCFPWKKEIQIKIY